MGILAIALLFTATLNYVLISLSSLAYRAKAIGVHKCNGAGTGGIFGMFLWETAIIVCISLALIAFIILNFNEKIEELIQTPVGELFSLQNIWAPALVVLFLFFIGGIMPGRFFFLQFLLPRFSANTLKTRNAGSIRYFLCNLQVRHS